MPETNSTTQRTITGTVIAAAADKTITVRIDRRVRHPLYVKIIGRRSTIHVHDEHNEAQVGDRVQIVECRPMSKTKSWALSSIDERVQEV